MNFRSVFSKSEQRSSLIVNGDEISDYQSIHQTTQPLTWTNSPSTFSTSNQRQIPTSSSPDHQASQQIQNPYASSADYHHPNPNLVKGVPFMLLPKALHHSSSVPMCHGSLNKTASPYEKSSIPNCNFLDEQEVDEEEDDDLMSCLDNNSVEHASIGSSPCSQSICTNTPSVIHFISAFRGNEISFNNLMVKPCSESLAKCVRIFCFQSDVIFQTKNLMLQS